MTLLRMPISTSWLILALIFVKGILFVLLLPPWQGPDEPTRFEAAALVSESPFWPPAYGQDPALQGRIVSSMRQFQAWKFYDRKEPPPSVSTLSEANLPSGASILYEPAAAYLPFSVLIRWIPSENLLGRLYAGRFLSLLMHMACVILLYQLAGAMLPSRSSEIPRHLLVLFYGLHPQLSFLAASLHADNLGFLLSLGVLLLVVRAALCFRDGSRTAAGWVFLLTLLALAGISLYLLRKMIVLLPFVSLSVPLIFWPRWKRQGTMEAVSGFLLLFLAVIVSAALLLYHYPELLGWRLLSNPHLAKVEEFAHLDWQVWARYGLILFTTFWMALGSLVYKLSPGWLSFLALSLGVVFLGCFGAVWNFLRRKTNGQAFAIPCLWLHGLWFFWIFLSVLIAYGPHRPNPEGRYLLSAMPSIAVLWLSGLSGWQWLERNSDGLFGVRFWAAVSLLLCWSVFFQYLIPIFYLS